MRRTATAALLLWAPALFAADFYVDCAKGSDGASGRDPSSAWGALTKLNQTEFSPGDSIRLKQGTTCEGMLWPKGSGAPGRPITLEGYGEGARPIVNAKGQAAAIRLQNQHDWVIRGMEATGSDEYGVYVSGSGIQRVSLIDSTIHGVKSAGPMKAKTSGLVVFDGDLEDIVVDGVTAYDTNRWAGIILQGRGRPGRVAVRNSVVHHVYGDGIVLFALQDGVIEHSAAWYTGLEPSYSIGTPNSIWTWSCINCIVRETEGFFSDSPGVDGGVYDIDWGNSGNLVENNYGHDAQAYCVAVFGAGSVTSASEVRGNVCAGNGRSPRAALRHGDVFVYTWNRGSLDGVRIHDNTFLWDPPIDSPVLKVDAEFSGTGRNSFDHNVIASAVSRIADAATGKMALEANQNVSADSILRAPEPMPLPPDLAAYHIDWQALRGHYALVYSLDQSPESRSEGVVIESARLQYARKGLELRDAASAGGSAPQYKAPRVLLLDPEGRMLYRWEGYAPAKEIVFALRKLLGPPAM